MSGDSISLVLSARKVMGKQVRGLRRDGLVPGVIHDHGSDSIVVMAKMPELEKVYREAGKHHPVDLSVGDKKYLALIKDVDFEPKKRTTRHVVFQAIKQDEKVEAEIPLHLTGEIPAEKASLMVITGLDHVVVEALPKNLPDSIEVDASVLAEIGDKITVEDLKAPEGVTIMTEPDTMVASVEMPKDQIAEADAAAASLAEDKAASEAGEEEEGTTEAEEPDSAEESADETSTENE